MTRCKPRNPFWFGRSASTAAFTLIELLVCLAILSLLIMIAIPNMRHSQTRARISKAKAEMNAVATAIEAYATDHNKYPICVILDQNDPTTYTIRDYGGVANIHGLTTPICYIDLYLVEDPFYDPDLKKRYGRSYYYVKARPSNETATDTYLLYSLGPSRQHITYARKGALENDFRDGYAHNGMSGLYDLLNLNDNEYWFRKINYDATNGTYSKGYLFRFR